MSRTFTAADGQPRCAWAASAPDFLRYHDEEWGYPVGDDIRLFEKVCLESFQSGLSWRTILDKRENFRAAFAGFDFNQMADFGAADVDRLVQDKGIIRHRGKIEAVISNAARAQELVAEAGSLAAFFWSYEPKPEELPEPQTASTSPESVALSKALKKRGWKFVGPTTVFAFMQAMGLINDHARGCICRQKADAARAAFTVPQMKPAA
ncbi:MULTISPECIES: DNA-3-methyladenine glycosylase I [Leisingera]|jgi:DNA-3-methyladenine glycosylase I|uniref:DNA-3-methyladenine glycosylase I n=1 Tax=Leisingera TaxID=191028 RepID=UPI001151AC56|nr:MULTISPECIES: DNA-3-methyladenine glycosylase I [Leisingera]QDI76351.1 DNA-3-methyladenine glycosylase I [Leisingera aquaemixtae]